MTGGRRDLMGQCDMNGWLNKGVLRKKRWYYRLQGPFLSEHENERSPSDTALWIQNIKVTRARNTIKLEAPGRRKISLSNPSVDVIDGWFYALNAAAKRRFTDHYTLHSMQRKNVTGTFVTAEEKATGRFVTVKVINKKNYISEDVRILHRELRIALTLSNPHIVNTLDVFDDGERFYIVLEHFDDAVTLFSECENFGILPEEIIIRLTRGILNALAFLHSLEIVHGDLTLDNVIVTSPLTSSDWQVKLLDFGYGAILDPEPRYQAVKDQQIAVESWYYVAPEQLRREVSTSIDVWAAGICLFYMFYQKYPFRANKVADTLQKIRLRALSFPPDADRVSSVQARVFMQMLLEKNTSKRCTVKSALRHPFVYPAAQRLTQSEDEAIRQVNTGYNVQTGNHSMGRDSFHTEASTAYYTGNSFSTAPQLSDPLNMLMINKRSGKQASQQSSEPYQRHSDVSQRMSEISQLPSEPSQLPTEITVVKPISVHYKQVDETVPVRQVEYPHPINESPVTNAKSEPSRNSEEEMVFSFHTRAGTEERPNALVKDTEEPVSGGDTPRVLKWHELPRDEAGRVQLPEQMPEIELYTEAAQRQLGDRQRTKDLSDLAPKPMFGRREVRHLSDVLQWRSGEDIGSTGRGMSAVEQRQGSLTGGSSMRGHKLSESSMGRLVTLKQSAAVSVGTSNGSYELDPYEDRWFR